MVDLSKRSWLKAQSKSQTPLRPPWSLDENEFIAHCTRCNSCIDACENGIIKKGGGGFPELDFSQFECTFCQACVTVCSDGALNLSQRPVISQQPEIQSACLTYEGVYCRSCADVCMESAIQFKYHKDNKQPAIAVPELNLDLCNQCGACVAPCPTNAIQFVPLCQNEEQASYV